MGRLLVVDDDDKIRTHLASYLRGIGHSVEVAADGVEALRIAGSEAIEVVISDGKGKMKGLKGKLTPEEIKAVAGHVKTMK